MPFQTKICGVTSPEDASMVAKCGVDAIGLNFFEESKRFIDVTTAERIVRHLPRTVKRVGVFVNATHSEAIRETANAVELDYVQLHGDEPPSFLSELAGLQVIRAFRYVGGIDQINQYLAACHKQPAAALVDAYEPNEYGGTGKTLKWCELKDIAIFGGIPLILAGGLTPFNVATAISEARPHGVDTASGVEKKPHIQKSADLCHAFVHSAKSAFNANS